MCIIIQRDADFVIPKDKFLLAVENNPHGYGVSVVENDGYLSTFKYVPEEVDAEALYEQLHNEFAGDQLLIHLRYTTAGETTLRNAHPFPILEKDKDGVDLRMAHNGTIHKFKPHMNAANKWESDTRVFVREYVRPLFKRMVAGVGVDNLLKDDFIQDLLSDIIPASSVLSFVDGFGNTMNVNAEGNGGKQEEGWYYSNTYSFREGHRTPKVTQQRSYGYGNTAGFVGDRWDENDWENYYCNNGYKTSTKTTPTKPVPATQAIAVKPKKDHAMDTKTERFSDKYELDQVNLIEDLLDFGDTLLDVLFDEAPEDGQLLCKELLGIVHALKTRVEAQQKTIEGMSSKLKESADVKAA